MTDRNAPKPAPAQAACDEAVAKIRRKFDRKTPDLESRLAECSASYLDGWHAALRFHGLKR